MAMTEMLPLTEPSAGSDYYCSKLIPASSLSTSSFLPIPCTDDTTNEAFTPKKAIFYMILSSTDTRVVVYDIDNSTIIETYSTYFEADMTSSWYNVYIAKSDDGKGVKYKAPVNAFLVQTRVIMV